MARPNVVQAMLEGISMSQPQPKIQPELIKYLGKTYNAWNVAIPLLESHVVMFPDEMRCLDALLDLYRGVGEDDVMCGLWRRRCKVELTRACLTLVQAGHWERAEELLGEAVRQGQQGLLTTPQGNGVPRGESALWVEQWVSASKQLGHWDTLMEYSRATENHELAVDCLWRLSDWPGLKDTLVNKAQVEEGVPTLMTRVYLALQVRGVAGGETLNPNLKLTGVGGWALSGLRHFEALVTKAEACLRRGSGGEGGRRGVPGDVRRGAGGGGRAHTHDQGVPSAAGESAGSGSCQDCEVGVIRAVVLHSSACRECGLFWWKAGQRCDRKEGCGKVRGVHTCNIALILPPFALPLRPSPLPLPPHLCPVPLSPSCCTVGGRCQWRRAAHQRGHGGGAEEVVAAAGGREGKLGGCMCMCVCFPLRREDICVYV